MATLAARAGAPHILGIAVPGCGARYPNCRLIKGHVRMTKLSFGAHPYLLGFEQLERLVERTAKSGAEGYPPFNIEAVAENAYRISLAVAGFREDDLAITIEDRQLVIRGRQADDIGDRVFLHRGIAARAFQRSFVLADGVEVAGAAMEHGLLHIDLRRSVPETVVQTIKIGRNEKGRS
jgi:HSP20 family molecular chaperone IbpA